MMNETYDFTYQYKPDGWHTHYDVDKDTAEMVLRMLWELDRDCRVRQNATGIVLEMPRGRGIEPLNLLHLFFKRISDRNGKVAEESAAEQGS